MKDFFKYTIWLIGFLSLSMILHSVSQIRDHNVETWLPWYLYSSRDWFEWIPFKTWDAYHAVKWASFMVCGFAHLGWMGLLQIRSLFKRVLYYLVAWIIAFQVFNLFYHIVWRL